MASKNILFIVIFVFSTPRLFATTKTMCASQDSIVNEQNEIYSQEILNNNYENVENLIEISPEVAKKLAYYYSNEKTDGIKLYNLKELPIDIAKIIFTNPIRQPLIHIIIEDMAPEVYGIIAKNYIGSEFIIETHALSSMAASKIKKIVVDAIIVRTNDLSYKTASSLKGFLGIALSIEAKNLVILDREKYPEERYPVESVIGALKGAKSTYLHLKFPKGENVNVGIFKGYQGNELTLESNTLDAKRIKNITKTSKSSGYIGFQGDVLKLIVDYLTDNVYKELIRFPNVLAIAATRFTDSNIENILKFEGNELRLKTSTFTDEQIMLIINTANIKKLNILLVVEEISAALKEEIDKSKRVEIELPL